MCFSQTASFGAATVLAGIGVVAMSQARSPLQKTVALMPLFFAAQQACEGLLWLSLSHAGYAHWAGFAKYSFLFFAEMLWPVYMPLIAWMAAQQRWRRNAQAVLFAYGLALALQLAYGLAGWPAYASIHAGHIYYDLRYPPVNTVYYGALYFLATVLPLLLTQQKLFRFLGFGLIVSYAASRTFYNHYVISIWCYFSAFLSFIALAIIRSLRTANADTSTPDADTSRPVQAGG